jgi:hypothetical protein
MPKQRYDFSRCPGAKESAFNVLLTSFGQGRRQIASALVSERCSGKHETRWGPMHGACNDNTIS